MRSSMTPQQGPRRPRDRRRLLRPLLAATLTALVVIPTGNGAGAAVNGITEYEVPMINPGMTGITPGPDDAMWFVEEAKNRVGRITTTGVVTEFSIPTADSQPVNIVAGPDGNLWFTEYSGSNIGRITPAGAITEFPVTPGSSPFDITVGPDGNLWFTEFSNSTVARMTTAGVLSEFQPGGCSERPTGITAGPDGKLWFTAHGCNSMVGAIDTDGVPASEVDLPEYGEPYDIVAGPDGNLWFSGYADAAIWRVTPTGTLTKFATPTPESGPIGVAAGPDGNVWFTEAGIGRVASITPAGVILEYALPIPSSSPYSIAPGSDGRMWFTSSTLSYIGALGMSAVAVPAVQQLTPDHGPATGGASIVITGGGFTGADQVLFTSWSGSVPATSFTVDSDSQITAVAPELGPRYWDVTVVNTGNTSAVSSASRYLSVTPVLVNGLDRTTASPAGGTVIRVFGEGFSAATGVTFDGVPGTDLLVSGDNDLVITVPGMPSHTVADVQVVTPYGTSPVVPEGQVTYLYEPHPVQISPDTGPAAGGTPAVLSGNDFAGVTQVNFGSTSISCPGQCTVVSNERIELVVPAHPMGGVNVTATAPDGPSPSGPTFAFGGVGTFSPAGSCDPDCAQSGAVVLPSGKVLGVDIDQANIYDPATDTWTPAAKCDACPGLAGSVGATLTALPAGPASVCGTNCGKVLAIGFDGAALYDPQVNTWAPIANMAVSGFSYPTATLLKNGKVLDVRGTQSQLFDPLTGTFSAAGDLNHLHNSHAATLLNDGRVLVSGGGGQTGPRPFSTDAELFDPATGTWMDTGQMAQARFAHTSTLLPDGRVLVTGGQIGFSAPITSAEIWNPATGAWSPTANMIFARSDHTASALPDGRVLVIGGDEPTQDFVTRDPIGHNPTIGEIFDPATQEWQIAANPPQLYLDTNNIFGQSNNARSVVLPSGPASVCSTRCGRVLAMRSIDFSLSENSTIAPSAVLYAPTPRGTLTGPATGSAGGGTAVTITGTGLASVTAVTFGGAAAVSATPDPATPDTTLVAVAPAHSPGAVPVAVTTAGGSVVVSGQFTFTAPPATPAPTPTPVLATPSDALPLLPGYALVGGDGGVFNFGGLPFLGSVGDLRPAQPVVGIEHTPTGKGYWLVGADGGISAFGDAHLLGSTASTHLARPIVAIKGTATGKGYWLVAADGGVIAFGDARFFGSTGAMRLNAPIVGMERTATGNGYWLVAADGGVFAFGGARFAGSTGAMRLAKPIVAISRSAGGAGYHLVGADGGIFAFGDAVFHGSTGAMRLNSPIVGMAAPPVGSGYWLCARDGGVFAFGTASFLGSMGGVRLQQAVAGCSAPRPTL